MGGKTEQKCVCARVIAIWNEKERQHMIQKKGEHKEMFRQQQMKMLNRPNSN